MGGAGTGGGMAKGATAIATGAFLSRKGDAAPGIDMEGFGTSERVVLAPSLGGQRGRLFTFGASLLNVACGVPLGVRSRGSRRA